MHCTFKRDDAGNTFILCGDRQRRRRCVYCPEWGTKLCDGPKGFGGKKTCDLSMCDGCAVHVADDVDLCHACFKEKTMDNDVARADGLFHVPGFLSAGEITGLIEIARKICTEAPLRRPTMPDGTPLKLTLTNAGDFGWWSDSRGGYRYIMKHPTTGKPFPPIPAPVTMLAQRALARCGLDPMPIENCLINHYAPGESLGLHVDRTEDDKDAPIISFSIGADAEFAMGGREREDRTEKFCLRSGDLVVQSGPSRKYYHGITKLFPTMGNPLKDGGRINFTLRKVTRAVAQPAGLRMPDLPGTGVDQPDLCAVAGCGNPVFGGGVCAECVAKVHGERRG